MVRNPDGSLGAVKGDTFRFNQERGLVVLESPTVGLLPVVPVGMTLISSVVLTPEVGAVLGKGDPLGYFQFGGSRLPSSRSPRMLDSMSADPIQRLNAAPEGRSHLVSELGEGGMEEGTADSTIIGGWTGGASVLIDPRAAGAFSPRGEGHS